MAQPEDVTIIVHGARGLQGRKSGRHKFSVIFGVGSKKFRTDVVKDPTGCPDFNEEIVVPVANPEDNVTFTVTEKEDILGQLLIPVSSLQSTKGRILRAVLLPHRKCPKPQGELIYQCYVSKFRAATQVAQHDSFTSPSQNESHGGFTKLKNSLATTPILPRKLRKNKRSDTLSIGGSDKHDHKPLSSLNKRFSRSLHNLINFARGLSEPDDNSVEKRDGNLQHFKATSTNYMDEIGQRPVVSAITPNSALVSGGTQLVIIGRHLGMELTDIVTFTLCGCDLRDYLQYESTMRLYCKTRDWPAQTGDLVIETTSGGRTVIKSAFSFVEHHKKMSLTNETIKQSLPNGSTEQSKTPMAVVSPAITVTPPSSKNSSLTAKNNKNSSSSIGMTNQNQPTDETIDDGEHLNINDKSIDSPGKSKSKNKKDAVISRHVRHSSETVTGGVQRDRSQTSWSNEELLAEVHRLELENKALKLESLDMKAYIEKLLAKVMMYCPQALENETDT